mmetsp:Transcript_14345/g.18797  ORF Transcript_14345/g.18797 Transcript_14345/m.18797 type:complete len:92 (+) Transcript_14345:418-693(+)
MQTPHQLVRSLRSPETMFISTSIVGRVRKLFPVQVNLISTIVRDIFFKGVVDQFSLKIPTKTGHKYNSTLSRSYHPRSLLSDGNQRNILAA